MSVGAQKILVCNNVCGRWKELFTKVSNLMQSKGLFNTLFCLGSFFPVTENKELEKEMELYLDQKLKGLILIILFIY